MYIQTNTKEYQAIRQNLELLDRAARTVSTEASLGLIAFKTQADIRIEAVTQLLNMYMEQEDVMKHAMSEIVSALGGVK